MGTAIFRIELSDPFRVSNPKKRIISYIHTAHKSKCRIARAYTCDSFSNNLFLYKHTQSSFTMAYEQISFTLREGIEKQPEFWKINTSRLKDRAYQQIIEKTIQNVLALLVQDPIKQWLVFRETVRIETQAYCKRKCYFEKVFKNFCKQKLKELEQDPLLRASSVNRAKYEYHSSKLDDWNKSQIAGQQTRFKTQP